MDDLRSKIKLAECFVHLRIEEESPNEIRGNFQCSISNESDLLALKMAKNMNLL